MFKLAATAVSAAVLFSLPGLASAKLRVCLMIATGGTIAQKFDPIKKAPVPALSGEDLLETVPEIGKYAKIEVFNQSRIASTAMDPAAWTKLAGNVQKALDRPDVAGVMVSHGTDTLEETAFFLDLTVRSDKPVILVGSQRNASESDFDGPRNLVNAARLCVSPEGRGKGVMLMLNGQINAARDVVKGHTSAVESFNSGQYGYLGVVDMDRIAFYREPMRRQHIPLKSDALADVEIVYSYGGVSARSIDAAVAGGAKGIVVASFGLGNVNEAQHNAIKAAIAKGVKVVISTRVPNGRVQAHYGSIGGGKLLQEMGAIFADNLSPQKARVLLMLAMQHTSDTAKLQAYFDK